MRKTEEEGRTAKPRAVIEKHNSKKERQKRDEHENNRNFDPTQPNR